MGSLQSTVNNVIHECSDPLGNIVDTTIYSDSLAFGDCIAQELMWDNMTSVDDELRVQREPSSAQLLFTSCESVEVDITLRTTATVDTGDDVAQEEQATKPACGAKTKIDRCSGENGEEDDVIPSSTRLFLEPSSAFELMKQGDNAKTNEDIDTGGHRPTDTDSDYLDSPVVSPSRKSLVGENDVNWADVGSQESSIFRFLKDSPTSKEPAKKNIKFSQEVLVRQFEIEGRFIRTCRGSAEKPVATSALSSHLSAVSNPVQFVA